MNIEEIKELEPGDPVVTWSGMGTARGVVVSVGPSYYVLSIPRSKILLHYADGSYLIWSRNKEYPKLGDTGYPETVKGGPVNHRIHVKKNQVLVQYADGSYYVNDHYMITRK